MAINHNCSHGWLTRHAFKPLIIVFLTALVAFSVNFLMWWQAVVAGSIIAILITIGSFIYAFRETDAMAKFAYKFSRTFRLGWWGEYLVRRKLRKLPDDVHVFYDVMLPNDKGNTDFVIVSKKGIFTIEVKNHSDKKCHSKWFNKEKDQALKEAKGLYRNLTENNIHPHRIQAILVRADQDSMPHQLSEELDVLGLGQILEYFEKQEETLSQSEVEQTVSIILNIAQCKS